MAFHAFMSLNLCFFLLCLPGFVAIYNVFLKLINIFVFIVFNPSGFLVFGFHPDRNHTKCFYCHGKYVAPEGKFLLPRFTWAKLFYLGERNGQYGQ